MPWICAGDFYEITKQSEKKGGGGGVKFGHMCRCMHLGRYLMNAASLI